MSDPADTEETDGADGGQGADGDDEADGTRRADPADASGADVDPAALARRVETGDLRLHELEEHAPADVAAAARRRLVADAAGADLSPVGEYGFPAEVADANVENMVGAVQVPLGVAGPVTVRGGAGERRPYLPLATTEGALVASVNRGCSVVEAAGGADARVVKSGMTRAPVFRVDGVVEAEAVVDWVREAEDRLAAAAESTTSHGQLVDVTPYVVGDSVFLRFRYDTKDAMGMNMATIATRAAADLVEEETAATLVSLSGNLCSDKKPAAVNAVEGRGRSVVADVTVPRGAVEDRLHTTPEAVAELNRRKNLVGSAKAASLGFNAHVANVVAATFLATGQDAAQVVEGANAITTAEARADGLYLSVSLASLEVGTVGGGTRLPTQAACLDLLGVRGGGDPPGANADALAETVAVGALAGELSLLSALASRHLSSAHESLGR
jgi:hydroxymethylglutaryl-CoA reductase (NADPH)